ncbi:TetR bacterial regulatory protein HTH signature [Desulfitobacterium hafniense]|uniref:TetR bacterial regulatory protein HTH signature n=1 Tax=Desulfitobacterium hafniense TaxID=49338 RepID=A0A098B5L9_DESHA|nr:TetR/AcrR family transcriptional regulator [Desulfitobacterium hafniense]CDX04183.1 TetR bacterial regulatory protein HTH signature [Desulfitobacterium hafniense]
MQGKRLKNKLAMEEKIYKAGMKLFEKKGYEYTTLQEIAELAQVSTSTLHKYFPAKEDILLRTARSKTEHFLATAKALSEDLDARSKIETLFLEELNETARVQTTFKIQMPGFYSSDKIFQLEKENKTIMGAVYKEILINEQRKKNCPISEENCSYIADLIITVMFHILEHNELDESFDGFSYTKKFLDVLWKGIDDLLF